MMQDIWNVLPDDRPLTGMCIVEDPSKCPPGYLLVSKTFDQDIDADLWKDGFFGKRITRYICISKEKNPDDVYIESLEIIGEKESPPANHLLVSYTVDTEQKAMRKKQLCYKPVPTDKATYCVTDIIVLSKSKLPPAGFTMAGDINNLIVCFKRKPVSPRKTASAQPGTGSGHLPYSLTPTNGSGYQALYPRMQSMSLGHQTLSPSSGSSSQFLAIDGIPFSLNPKLRNLRNIMEFSVPSIKMRTEEDLDREFHYDFSMEHQAQQAVQQERNQQPPD